MDTKTKPKLIIEATVIRKDGATENLGRIAECKELNIIQKFIRSVNRNG